MKPLHHFSAVELTESFQKGEVSATEIAEYFLERIEKHNSDLGAFLTVFEPRMLQKAKELDEKRANKEPLGRLAGVPIAIKDNTHVQGEITSCGSKFQEGYRAPFSATVVRLLEEEGALLTGKANLDEFAMGSSNENSAFYSVKNPQDPTRVPGGSSGGSAALVGAGLSLIATGSDTGGSIRQPAAFCGIVGYKPTYGRVSRYGLVAFGSSLDQIGPFAANVGDIALSMGVMGRFCEKDATSLELPQEHYPLSQDLSNVVFGAPYHYLEGLRDDVKENYLASLEKLKSLGAQVVDIDLDILKYSLAVYYILSTAEASTNLARFDGIRYGKRAQTESLDAIIDRSREEGFGAEVKRRIMLGTYVLASGYQNAYYTKALKVRTRIVDAFETVFNTCDAIAMPVAPSGAFKAGTIREPLQMYLQDIFTIPANLAGLPAISVPSGLCQEGMPLGLQIVGPQLSDTSVIQYGYAFEKAVSPLPKGAFYE